MSDESIPRPTAKQILKAVFWNRWGAIVGAILGIFGVLDFIDAHFAPRFPATVKTVWGGYYVLPSLGLRTWITIVSLALLVVAIHGAYVFAKGYSTRYAELTRYKIKFKIDEVSSRVFVQTPSKERIMIMARINLQFENHDIHPWSMKKLNMTLHKLGAPDQEIYTLVASDEYLDASSRQSIPREQFEGMPIPGGRVTLWYTYWIWLVVSSDEEIKKPEDLTGAHFLKLSMEASNQAPFESHLLPNWTEATKQDGGTILSYGAPAFRVYENRRLGE